MPCYRLLFVFEPFGPMKKTNQYPVRNIIPLSEVQSAKSSSNEKLNLTFPSLRKNKVDFLKE